MTRPLLTFAIPTWNHAEYLKRAVESIAAQVKASAAPVEIIISDNASDDASPDVIAGLQRDYPFVSSYRRGSHGDYADSFRTAFSLADSEWCWTFGDDDVLLPGALDYMLSRLRGARVDFFHVSEDSRASGADYAVTGSLLSLCEGFGWIEICGFISCNIIRTDLLREAVRRPSWEIYRRNAFAHACAILEVTAYRPAALVDMPLVALQKEQEPEELGKRFAAGNTSLRYFYLDDALVTLVGGQHIPARLNRVFLRYHRYFLWDRLISGLLSVARQSGETYEELWQRTRHLADFLEDDAARDLRRIVDSAHQLTGDFLAAAGRPEQARLGERLKAQFEERNKYVFDYAYVSRNLIPDGSHVAVANVSSAPAERPA